MINSFHITACTVSSGIIHTAYYLPPKTYLLASLHSCVIMAGPKLELGGFPIPWTRSIPPEDQTNMYPYKKQVRNTRKLPVGWRFAEGRRALHEELILDEVVEIPLRDGVKVRSTTERTHGKAADPWPRSTATYSGPSGMRGSLLYLQ